MKLVDLIRLGELDVDQVRADLAILERAVTIGRAILAELERDTKLSDAKAVADRFGLSLTDAKTTPAAPSPHAPPEPDAVRPAEEPVEPPRAEPPATPEHSSQPSEPPAASTPTDSTAASAALLRADVLAHYRERPGAWIGSGTVARHLHRQPMRVAQACRDLAATGDLEHNDKKGPNSRYRAPAPDLADAVEPDVEHAIATTTARPPATSPPETVRKSALAGPPMLRPSYRVSASTRRAIAAEERDGPRRDNQDLTPLGRDILRWLGRNGSGTAGEISRSMVRAIADVSLELKTIEEHNGHLIERRGRGDSGALKYGLSPAGVQQQEASA